MRFADPNPAGAGETSTPAAARSCRSATRQAFALVAAVLAAVLAGPASGAAAIHYERLSHPRLLISSQELPLVRAWLNVPGSDNQRLFSLWHAYLRTELLKAGTIGSGVLTDGYLDDIAAMYLLGGGGVIEDAALFGDAAVRIAMWTARNGKQQGSAGSGLGGGSTLALAYDWCYDRFTAAQRDTLRGCLARAASLNRSAGGQWYWYHVYRYEYSLAIVDDADVYTWYAGQFGEESFSNAQIRSWFEEYSADLQDGYIPCLNQVAPGGYQESYPGRRQVPMLSFIASLDDLVDWNPWAEPSVANIGRCYLARYRPDGEFIRTPEKYNYAQASPYFIFSLFGSRGRDARCQALANIVDDGFPTNSTFGGLWQYLLYHDPSAPATNLHGLGPDELIHYDRGQGVFLGRTGWNLGPASQDIMTGFWSGGYFGPYAGEWNRHLGHFVVSRGDDCLLIDSGSYMNDDDNHHRPYGKSTIAHNAISIFRPGMDFGEYNDCHSHPQPLRRPNDGGQEGADRSFERCPDCNRQGDGGLAPFYSGWIDHLESDEAAVRIEADLTPAYRSRASRVLRRWWWVRPDWIVVQDRIDTEPGNGDTIRVVFHSVERPVLNGTLVTERGSLLHGGVFRSSNTTRVVVNLDDSSARIFFGPTVGAGARFVRVIGGVNAGGTYNAGWQQDHDPFADEQEPSDHYDTYSPGATSYEFWIDGRNYPPADTDCRVGDGAYAARNKPAVGRKASPAGDWRIEYQTVATSSPVILTSLIHVTARNASEEYPSSTYESTDSMSIRLRLPLDAGDVREIVLGPPGGTHARGAGQFRGGP